MDFTQLFVNIFGKLARNHGIADLIFTRCLFFKTPHVYTSRILSGLQDSPGFRGMKSSAVDIGLSSPKTPRFGFCVLNFLSILLVFLSREKLTQKRRDSKA